MPFRNKYLCWVHRIISCAASIFTLSRFLFALKYLFTMSTAKPNQIIVEKILLAQEYVILLTVFALILVSAALYQMVRIYAYRKMKAVKKVPKKDLFVKEYGYSWDYVFVFKVWDEEERMKLTEYQTKFSMKFIIERIVKGGIA